MVSIPHWRYQQEDAELNQNPSQKIQFWPQKTTVANISKEIIKRIGVAQKAVKKLTN